MKNKLSTKVEPSRTQVGHMPYLDFRILTKLLGMHVTHSSAQVASLNMLISKILAIGLQRAKCDPICKEVNYRVGSGYDSGLMAEIGNLVLFDWGPTCSQVGLYFIQPKKE